VWISSAGNPHFIWINPAEVERDMVQIVGVLGAGQMGNGIAHVFAQYGFQVKLYDVSAGQLDKAQKTIRQNLDRQVKKGVIDTGSIQPILDRITIAGSLEELSSCDLIIEAVNENESLKFD
jgi:3-hydroxybutyryl-CoA dehydrogenase